MPEQEPTVIETQNENKMLHNLRVLGVAGLASGVALFGANRIEAAFAAEPVPSADAAQSDADYTSDEWPPIDQEIDGKEFGGNQGTEQAVADGCKRSTGLFGPYDTNLRPGKSSTRVLRSRYSLDPIEVCNGYGRRTVEMRVQTKRAGQTSFKNGKVVTLRTNGERDNTVRSMRIAQSCRGSLFARLVSKVSYEHLDGDTVHKTYRSKTQHIAC